eukprot:g2599.t1
MKDHANAAQRLCVMEERLSEALYREQAAVRKEERRKGKLLRGLRLAQRFRDLRALPAHKRSSKEVQINDFTVLHGDNFGPKLGAADIHDTEIATTGDVMIVDERVETEVGEGIELIFSRALL